MKIVVAGTGYVGLVTGACLAEVGHNVTCVDIDKNKVEIMKQGISPIYEPGLDELLKRNYNNKKLDFTIDYKNAYKDADVVFIGVGTPEREDGSANLDYVFKVCEQIANNIEKDCLVVIKSTVPIGTNDRVELVLRENLKNDVRISVASNPEFLAQGTAISDTLNASRIVIGVENKKDEEILKKIYGKFKQPIIVTNRRSAEMIKYASNDFLALKISFINEIANVCEIVGANIEDVTKGMSYDKRIGEKFLKAGLGYGGSCFPKDTKALHWLANENGYEIKTIKAAIEVNENQKYKLFRKAKNIFGSLRGKKIAVLGLTFKPGTDDLREAPSIPNIRRFLEEGAEVVAYDPVGINNFKKIYKNEIRYTQDIYEAVEESDMTFIFTEWNEIKSLDLNRYKEIVKTPIIFDGRNCFNLNELKEKNVKYYSIGREEIN
ncbi:UDP-glucose/GDP-mannose dehydrogenase family protein [Clostridium perfringens]|uniref:UDP-glucose dehydrogenase family protein n=1 Tax=Clostridium perfringens TaxID=1502 RepID=UPI00016BC6DE|nr:UDP-glucose/GDP-mannose dehydrogenase family protein [Clostridium perfringens]EDT79023.1 udp-glucose 6-dehydrogenase [Clostridium perfringens NCTC 8239]ELC8383140.1 UDP-glucose/GDP-mannose dehydrogenase family protein [Clostridium perfringens]MCX0359286.1 UDP-glucose/GDP-mannose dehydrogenase family protein [Clostridium perfringens]MCX0420465.1 UDP-glucose/GDP-mannose dehydrogenase family protein [Clostridium perfringens]MDK0589005.1 UDP-glucose/GDP-mannose dehydrogenase family protein [Clo